MRDTERETGDTAEREAPESGDAEQPRHDDRLIEAHLRLSPTERLEALQSFVDDVIRMRDGRRPPEDFALRFTPDEAEAIRQARSRSVIPR